MKRIFEQILWTEFSTKNIVNYTLNICSKWLTIQSDFFCAIFPINLLSTKTIKHLPYADKSKYSFKPDITYPYGAHINLLLIVPFFNNVKM